MSLMASKFAGGTIFLNDKFTGRATWKFITGEIAQRSLIFSSFGTGFCILSVGGLDRGENATVFTQRLQPIRLFSICLEMLNNPRNSRATRAAWCVHVLFNSVSKNDRETWKRLLHT